MVVHVLQNQLFRERIENLKQEVMFYLWLKAYYSLINLFYIASLIKITMSFGWLQEKCLLEVNKRLREQVTIILRSFHCYQFLLRVFAPFFHKKKKNRLCTSFISTKACDSLSFRLKFLFSLDKRVKFCRREWKILFIIFFNNLTIF